jgi:hypothetical protein
LRCGKPPESESLKWSTIDNYKGPDAAARRRINVPYLFLAIGVVFVGWVWVYVAGRLWGRGFYRSIREAQKRKED